MYFKLRNTRNYKKTHKKKKLKVKTRCNNSRKQRRQKKSRRIRNSRRQKIKKVGGAESTKLNDPNGLIEEYLSGIRGWSEGVKPYLLNGNYLDCTEKSGPLLLCKQLINDEKFLRANVDPAPPMTRSTAGYVGHGAFGMVFSMRVGRVGIQKNIFAVKLMEGDFVKDAIKNEVFYQKKAAAAGIAPEVYDYFLYNCEDGVLRGIIIMEFLSGYKNGYEISNEIQESIAQYDKTVGPGVGNRIYDKKNAEINKNYNALRDKLAELNIMLPDFQTNFMINNNNEIKAVDFGMAQPTVESMAEETPPSTIAMEM